MEIVRTHLKPLESHSITSALTNWFILALTAGKWWAQLIDIVGGSSSGEAEQAEQAEEYCWVELHGGSSG
jgi:hypothetical protein